MKRSHSLFPTFLAIVLASSFACTHNGSQGSEGTLSADEATIHDSDSDTPNLTGNNDPEDLSKDDENAKDAATLIDNVSILFESKSTTLPESSTALLVNVAERMNSDSSLKLRLDAYSLKRGKDSQKKKLATETLDAVKTRLVGLGVDPQRIKVSAYSKDKIDSDRKVDVIFE